MELDTGLPRPSFRISSVSSVSRRGGARHKCGAGRVFFFCPRLPSVYNTLGKEAPDDPIPRRVAKPTSGAARPDAAVGRLAPGSITATTGRCGNPRCHCQKPGQKGHGPNYRLTFRRRGKTVTESFPNQAARRKAQREIDEFRRWQQLSRRFVEVSTQICQSRPVEETLTPQEKERSKRSSRKSPKR